jgi:hypothetical protein
MDDDARPGAQSVLASPPTDEGGRVTDRTKQERARSLPLAQGVFGVVLGLVLLGGISWTAARGIDDSRNARITGQYLEDAVVASLPLAPGMRPTPIAVVRQEDGARIIAVTIQDARHHRDDILKGSLGRSEVASFAPPSPMRDAFVRDLVQRVSARIDCRTGDLVAQRIEIAKGLSDRATYTGGRIVNNAGLPSRIETARAQVICSLPTTRG